VQGLKDRLISRKGRQKRKKRLRGKEAKKGTGVSPKKSLSTFLKLRELRILGSLLDEGGVQVYC